MKTRNINIYLLMSIIVALIVIFSVNKYEKYEKYSGTRLVIDSQKLNQDNSMNEKSKNNKKYDEEDKVEKFYNGYHGKFGVYWPYTASYIPQSPSQTKQILNRLTFDYPSLYDNPYNYPNTILPAHVIGCGGRRGACMGGSQIPIPNTIPPVNISEQNIAPVNLTVRGFDEGIQQVGTIQKVFGRDNMVYPLFGRKRYRNDNKWEYFVKFGQYGVILPIKSLRNYEELNTNDEVHIQSQKDKYRVTMYDEDIPQYLPFT